MTKHWSITEDLQNCGGIAVSERPEAASPSRAVPRGLMEQIEIRILSRVAGRLQNLQVILRDDGVVLKGRAKTYHVKQLAQHAVLEMTGVRLLANDIEVG